MKGPLANGPSRLEAVAYTREVTQPRKAGGD
jgi:hypothetical protein